MRTPYKDLTGQAFGFFIVLRRAETPEGKQQRTYWAARCRCGKEKVLRQEALTSGQIKSCGCAANRLRKAKLEKRYSLDGQRFGRLTVVWRAGSVKYGDQNREGGSHAVWECKCDCGNMVKVTARSLRGGKTQSCGCLLKDLWLPAGKAVRNVVLKRYQRDAEKEGRKWSLSDARFDELVQGNCHYCGTPPVHATRAKGCNGEFVCNGIDRLNSKLGYVEGNVVSCCYPCNLMKRAMSLDAFIAHIRKVLDHWDSKNALVAKV